MAGISGPTKNTVGKSPKRTPSSSRPLASRFFPQPILIPVNDNKSRSTISSALSMPTLKDKSVCQYCGVSYITISEMRSLQTTVKEQEERLSHYKTMMLENVRLKDHVTNLKKSHLAELMKREEEFQRIQKKNDTLKNQLETLEVELKGARVKQLDAEDKYTILSADARQQEEVISQLRDSVQDKGDMFAENVVLHDKVRTLEDALKKALELRPLEKPSPTMEKHLDKGDCARNFSNRNLSESIEFGDFKGQKSQEPQHNPSTQSGFAARKVSSLTSIEVHDLKCQVNYLSEKLNSLREEHANSSDMHNFLRETIDKQKVDNMHLHESLNSLKVKYEERGMLCSSLEAKLQVLWGENNRLKGFATEVDNKLRLTVEQNKAIRKAHDPKLVEQLQNTVLGLQRQFEQQKYEIEELNIEFEKKLAETQKETQMEKERADSCLASSVSERENIEKRWEERWDRHQSSLNKQLDSLKANYEETLRKNNEHEQALQKDLRVMKEKFEKSKEAWETYRKSLLDQIVQWKTQYEQKYRDLESTRKSKIDVEALFQTKADELGVLQEVVREGCEERQELQNKVDQLEASLEEARRQKNTFKKFNSLKSPNFKQEATNNFSERFTSGNSPGIRSPTCVPITHSNSDCTLFKSNMSPPDRSYWDSIVAANLGLEERPPVSRQNSSDLMISSKSHPPMQFTVGKGKNSKQSGGSSVSSVSAKDKTINKIGLRQQKNTKNNNNSPSTSKGTGNTGIPSRKSNK